MLVIMVASASVRGADVSGRETDSSRVRAELAALRQELARTKLELSRAVQDLKELREFLATPDVQEQTDRWRQEREELSQERQRLIAERRALEEARRRLHEQSSDEAAPGAPALGARPRYDLDYALSYIRTGTDRPVYIDFGDLLVPVEQRPDIDRRHVMVRGTIQNRSTESWRYTFEVRIAGRAGVALGRWRYQTPVLAPQELHPFEITVPVTDAGLVYQYQIGNIEPDQPKAAAGAEAPAGEESELDSPDEAPE
jgi:hypothetical protein